MRIRFLLLSILVLQQVVDMWSQGHDWWANNVQWDGVTHWSEYIISAPRYMGPNALPVPPINPGVIRNDHFIAMEIASHFNPGDKTQNLAIRANYNLVTDLISFDVYWIPWEHYNVSHITKTERNVFHTFYDETTANGDLYLNTNVRVWNKPSSSGVLRLGYKFPTSSKQGAARYTNAPGYYLDLGTSWLLSKSDEKTSLRILNMLGFYAWQTNLDEQFQNDAFLTGVGIEYRSKRWVLTSGIRAYFGYLVGDKPIVLRQDVEHRWDRWSMSLGVQHGVQHFPYTSLMVCSTYHLSNK